MMKNKLISFLVAMGIPVSAISTQGAGCSSGDLRDGRPVGRQR